MLWLTLTFPNDLEGFLDRSYSQRSITFEIVFDKAFSIKKAYVMSDLDHLKMTLSELYYEIN
jgi:hypothetical protein